ncbi:GGDEF domain-containing protein [Agarilytica rhodophyticola]|uniref:GGDEF domain-containing protein n=1 Tax=Agarilytica rhodophyticola TaxID=1737490 RepID=UPI000B34265C|nr:GGDEF domain-containing protein [Agarilytica rhodophyticola]
MVESAGGGYREKYRQAIAEQERMEKQFKFQLDALRKTLNHVSAAAKGLDKHLDASLILLKEKMRGATGSQVLEQMERVQAAAADYEHSRQASNIKSAKQISSITDQLLELKLPSEVKDSLQSYSAGLKKRLTAYRNYPDVLEELSKMQSIAIEAASNPSMSFWQRLKGGNTLKTVDDGEASTASDVVEQGANSFEEVLEDMEVDLAPKEGELIKAYEDVGAFDAGDEDSYQKVAQRIARTLENLVSRIEPNDVVRHKIDIVRLRIQRGMDWYVLAITLEDIRDILLLRYLQNDQEFSNYLKRVNEELRTISESLGLVSDQDERQRQASDKFSSTVSGQVKKMRTNMENSNNVDELKLAVSDHLGVIQDALGDYDANKKNSDSITDQLKSLINQVQSIESESKKTKALLEEERHRATHDALTGLPNREAYNERSFQELQRFNRYKRSLTLAVCDIDHFKKINDTYGHQAGDKVLKLIAQLISTRLRKVDFVARYGGEEFVTLMPETEPEQAVSVLDKIRAVIGKTPFKFKGNPVKITISFGLASFNEDDSVESVFERADKALYRAKNQGRNQCVIAGDAEEKTEN